MADEWDAAEEARRYQGTPYDRATYMRLQRLMAPIQAATNESHKRFNKRGMMSPPPTTQGYRDKEQYLFVNKDIFERETAAMMACVHSSSAPAKCVARAMIHGSQAPPMSMTASDRLAAIGRNSNPLGAFLARQLMVQPKGTQDPKKLAAMQTAIKRHHSAMPLPRAPSSPKKEGPSKRSRGGKLRKSRKSRKGRKK